MRKPITIAVASGKGGTGKTTISVSLAAVSSEEICLLDCDVEEPNCHIFLDLKDIRSQNVTVQIPYFKKDKCILCGKCSKICRFNAIINLPSGPMIFPELCHSCGGCVRVCKSGAIAEKKVPVGVVEEAVCGNIQFFQGRLDVGRAMSPPVIRAVKEHVSCDFITIIDCPPGTSCPMICAVKDADFVLLVTEPTPFGLNDLKLAVETVRGLKIPFGVILNRSDSGDGRVDDYCANESIPLLLRIPDSRSVAEAYSKGKTIIDAMPIIQGKLMELLNHIAAEVKSNRGAQ